MCLLRVPGVEVDDRGMEPRHSACEFAQLSYHTGLREDLTGEDSMIMGTPDRIRLQRLSAFRNCLNGARTTEGAS